MRIIILITFYLQHFHSVILENGRVVLEDGVVLGTTYKTVSGREIYGFFGMPYAAPPTGQNRFEPPQPLKPWVGEWNATSPGSICLQQTQKNTIEGQEDCLYLNVYTPRLPKNDNENNLMEVIAYIHGGAFRFGTGNEHRPDYLLRTNDIVFVTISYRLGPLGFLTTGDGVVPGNNGLKDQSKALLWIHNNIRNFGGDPTRVTIAGFSAGGISVHNHYFSPMSRGLFQNGISLSGTAFLPRLYKKNAPQKTKQLAAVMGCPTESTKTMIECLKTKSGNEIVESVKQFKVGLPFGPTIETPNAHSFLSEDPLNLLRRGEMYRVPWLTSNVRDEGIYLTAAFYTNETTLKYLDENWNNIAPLLMQYNDSASSDVVQELTKVIREKYFKNQSIGISDHKTLIKIVGDRLYTAYIEFTVRELIAKNNFPVYYYKFNYDGNCALVSDFKKYGISHGDDSVYILKGNSCDALQNAQDARIVELMVSIWISFVKTGKPQISLTEWPPAVGTASSEILFLNINSPEHVNVGRTNDTSVFDFWNSYLHEFSG